MKSPNSKSGSKSESKPKRREVIKLIGSTALAWPTATWAQSSPNVGILIAATDANDVWASYIKTFKDTLSDLMRPTTVNYYSEPSNTGGNPNGAAGVDYSTYFAAAQKLINNDKVSIIVTAGNLAAQACKDAATQTNAANPIPIVVASAGDLTGLTDGNLTGCTNGQQNLAILKERIKRMKLLSPTPTAVGIVGNDTVPPVAWAMHRALGWIPQILNVQACLIPLSQPSDLTDHATIRAKINSFISNSSIPSNIAVNALFVCSDPLLRTHGTDFVKGAHDSPKMNTMHEFGEWKSQHGGDLSFGPDFTSLFQKAAEFVYQYFENGLPLPAAFNPQVTDCVPT